MRIAVDDDRCEGHGLCEHAAPKVFTLDDEGFLQHHYLDKDIPAEFEQGAEAAVLACPVAALRVEQ